MAMFTLQASLLVPSLMLSTAVVVPPSRWKDEH